MGVVFGRAGADFDLVVTDWPRSGDSTTVSGLIRGQASLANVTTARDQLLGLANNTDEPVIPVTWDLDATVDGFYRVGDVSVSTDPRKRLRADSVLEFSVDLERVAGWQAPLFEVICRGALRTNSHSVTNGEPWVGAAQTADTYGVPGETVRIAGDYESAGGAGAAVHRWRGDATADLFYDAEWQYAADVDDYYDAAARIEFSSDSGTTWNDLIGRQIPGAQTAPDDWRLDNDHVRISVQSTVTVALVTLEVWDPGEAGWVDVITADLTDETAWARFGSTVTVLKNSPEVVTVRWSLTNSSGGQGHVLESVDFTLRRGASWVEIYRSVHAAFADRLIIADNDAGAATAITGGMHVTADDAFDNRWVMLSPDAQSNTLASGQLRTNGTSETTMSAMIGVEYAGTGASSTEDAAFLSTLYFAAMSHRQMIAAR